MAERGNFRGGGGGRGGRGDRGGGRGGGGRGGGHAAGGEKKKENILNLDKYLDKAITVKFNGGREGASCFHTRLANPTEPPSPEARDENRIKT